jgi:hypothetical protein
MLVMLSSACLMLLLRCCVGQARRFPEGSESRILYESGLQYFLICVVIVVLIAGGITACVRDSRTLD